MQLSRQGANLMPKNFLHKHRAKSSLCHFTSTSPSQCDVSKWNVCTMHTSNEHFQKVYFRVEQVVFPPIQNEMAHQMVQIQLNNEDRNIESE